MRAEAHQLQHLIIRLPVDQHQVGLVVSILRIQIRHQRFNSIERPQLSPALYSRQEFIEKATNKHHFITAVSERPKLFVIGNQGDLDALATGKARES